MKILTPFFICIALASSNVFAEEQKRFIPVYVLPYYESSPDGKTTPKVNVGKPFDELLASNKKEDILSAEKEVLGSPDLISPMTMMVLAIRLYDIGLRDKSVFWFYVAKDRFFSLEGTVNTKHKNFIQAEEAIISFATLTGPYFNGYAFCNIPNQQKIRKEALQWVIDNPYKVIYMKNVPLLPGGIDKNLKKTFDGLKDGLKKSKAYFSNKKNLDKFNENSKQNNIREKFCW